MYIIIWRIESCSRVSAYQIKVVVQINPCKDAKARKWSMDDFPYHFVEMKNELGKGPKIKSFLEKYLGDRSHPFTTNVFL